MKINLIDKILGSGFFSGYFPFASGTVGSLVAFGIYMIPGMENPAILSFLIALFTVWGIKIGTKFEKVYGKDPSQCTIDEFVGSWISLLFIPKKIWFILAAFVIWRVLDIVKPFPARQMEKLNGGLGIMMDDIVSGIYSMIIMHIIIYLTY